MPGLLIIAHAPLASALKAVAENPLPAAGAQPAPPDGGPAEPLEQVEAKPGELLAKVRNPQALILTDVFGATPANVAQRIADDPTQVKVIAGVNVPMLWRTLCYAEPSLDAMVARAVAGATQGVMQMASSRPQNQTAKPGAHGQDQRHDQQ